MRFASLASAVLLGILGGVIPAAAQTSAAQTSAAQTPDSLSTGSQGPGAAKGGFRETVVVTASLEEVESREVPASVTVFDREDIEARQAVSVLDLLATAPGFSVARSGSPGHATSAFARGTESDQTLALWNGIPLNDPFFGAFDWAYLSADGAERVEVVRGPLSTLYGSAALGGAVNVITGRQQGLKLRLESGEDGYGRGSLTAGGGTASAHYDLVASYRTGDGRQENDFYDGTDAVARAEWRLSGGAVLGLLGRVNDSEIGIPRSGSTLTPRRTQDWRSVELALPFELSLGRVGLKGHLSSLDTDFAFRDPDAFFDLNDTRAERLRARLVASVPFADSQGRERGWVAVGGDWHDEEVTNVSTFGTNLDGDSQTNWSAFAQVRSVWRSLTLAAGVRRDDNELFGGETSPNLSAILQVTESVRLRAGYGEGFRAPSLGELFFPFSGNPDLVPETSESWELAVEADAGAWRFGLTGFDIQQEDVIDFDALTFTNVNIGLARSRGVELEVAYRRGAVSARANGTLLEAEDRDTGLALVRRPEEAFNLVLQWAPGPWSLSAVGRWVGERPDLDPDTFARTTNPSYTRFDLAASWQALERLAPYARVENLADEDYQEALGFPAPGRTLIGGLALRF